MALFDNETHFLTIFPDDVDQKRVFLKTTCSPTDPPSDLQNLFQFWLVASCFDLLDADGPGCGRTPISPVGQATTSMRCGSRRRSWLAGFTRSGWTEVPFSAAPHDVSSILYSMVVLVSSSHFVLESHTPCPGPPLPRAPLPRTIKNFAFFPLPTFLFPLQFPRSFVELRWSLRLFIIENVFATHTWNFLDIL